jgi:hypothetical protein
MRNRLLRRNVWSHEAAPAIYQIEYNYRLECLNMQTFDDLGKTFLRERGGKLWGQFLCVRVRVVRNNNRLLSFNMTRTAY